MAFTQQMLDILDKAIAGGTRSVYYGDKRVEYRSLDEMLQVRKMMMLELGLIKPDSGTSFAEFDKGLHPRCSEDDDHHFNAWR